VKDIGGECASNIAMGDHYKVELLRYLSSPNVPTHFTKNNLTLIELLFNYLEPNDHIINDVLDIYSIESKFNVDVLIRISEDTPNDYPYTRTEIMEILISRLDVDMGSRCSDGRSVLELLWCPASRVYNHIRCLVYLIIYP
jgi:hypothetical protein